MNHHSSNLTRHHYLHPRLAAEADSSAARAAEYYDDGAGTEGASKMQTPKLFTIGHSTRSTDEFIGLLRANGVERVIDIRTIPKSRHNPQFNSDALAAALRSAGLDYVHLKALGGLRKPLRDSRNTAWRNASFRGFADYMQTPEFADALSRAVDLAVEKPSALMCSEAVPWRCHRSLVADALVTRDIEVLEIVSSAPPKPHKLIPFARVRGMQVTYPGGDDGGLFEEPASGKERSSSGRPRSA